MTKTSRIISLSVALLACTGCGVSEYQALMESEQKRIELIDEENKFLGDPVELPFRSAAPANPQDLPKPDVFFRLPKGFATKPEEKPFAEFFYHFTRKPNPPRSRVSPADAPAQENSIQDVYLAVAFDNKTKEFSDKVFQLNPKVSEMPRISKEPPGRAKLEYQMFSGSDAANPPSTYLFYFYQNPGQNILIAVVFHLPKDKEQDANVSKAINYSLQSLAVGSDAIQPRSRFAGKKS